MDAPGRDLGGDRRARRGRAVAGHSSGFFPYRPSLAALRDRALGLAMLWAGYSALTSESRQVVSLQTRIMLDNPRPALAQLGTSTIDKNQWAAIEVREMGAFVPAQQQQQQRRPRRRQPRQPEPQAQQQQQPQRITFGALDQVTCPRCGGRMWLTRRCPSGENYERQTFGCRACAHELERTVDAAGQPPAGDGSG